MVGGLLPEVGGVEGDTTTGVYVDVTEKEGGRRQLYRRPQRDG